MRLFLVFILTLGALGINACKDDKKETKVTKNLGGFSQQLPEFSLKDPHGKTFSKKDIIENGAVIVVTAPILSNKDDQEGWSEALDKGKADSKAKLVFLQDMGPSNFKGKALSAMKKEYKSGEEPILLIDEKGEVREKLKVKEKDTVVLVYDKDGKLIHSETKEPSGALASQIWNALK